MKAQVHPIFPEPLVEFSDTGIDQVKVQQLYAAQEWTDTNADDDPERFLKISKNLTVLHDDDDLRNRFEKLINQYAREVMCYENRFAVTTSWFVKTEKNKISVIHNHGNAVISAVYYFGLTPGRKSKITFERPFLSQFDIKPTEYNVFNGVSHQLELGNDSLLVFPSYLKHKVLRHQFHEERKSLAMNFMPLGIVGAGTTEIDLGEPG